MQSTPDIQSDYSQSIPFFNGSGKSCTQESTKTLLDAETSMSNLNAFTNHVDQEKINESLQKSLKSILQSELISFLRSEQSQQREEHQTQVQQNSMVLSNQSESIIEMKDSLLILKEHAIHVNYFLKEIAELKAKVSKQKDIIKHLQSCSKERDILVVRLEEQKIINSSNQAKVDEQNLEILTLKKELKLLQGNIQKKDQVLELVNKELCPLIESKLTVLENTCQKAKLDINSPKGIEFEKWEPAQDVVELKVTHELKKLTKEIPSQKSINRNIAVFGIVLLLILVILPMSITYCQTIKKAMSIPELSVCAPLNFATTIIATVKKRTTRRTV
ncbi:hypothetical protein BC833DRAFT_661715 [Globomyces pollinis-pini]|nr:hypothetical protein BC833DRAFT_661715 [Globomyces pollinis-pini]